MNETSPLQLLRVLTPTQSRLSFCDGTPRDLKRWIANLPKANIGETARLLYQALGELNQFLTPSDNRLQLLELLRPEVYYVCKHLERHFLQQAIVLDDRSRKIVNLCQALQTHLAMGYKQIVARIAAKYTKDRARLLSTALQRAMHALDSLLVRVSQIYSPVPEGLWLDLHQLYRIACQHRLQHLSVSDELASQVHQLNAEQTYVVALLLGASRSNQLRQSQIARLAEVLEPWSQYVQLDPATTATSLFAVAPELDIGPRYRSKFRAEQQPTLQGFDPQRLVSAIAAHLDKPADLPVPGGMSADTLHHLQAAWGEAAERSFQRTEGNGTLTLCVGMSALHYFLGGERSFSDILKTPTTGKARFEASPTKGSDTWKQAFDAAPSGDSDMLPYEEIEYPVNPADDDGSSSDNQHHFPTYDLPIVNHSPGGYCLAWPKEMPEQLQAGEMIGIRDASDQTWSVAVVRWIRQVRNGAMQMGIEQVAPHAQPCGLQLVREENEHGHYLRGLLLPEISAIDLPPTMIAPRLPFQEGQQILINTNGQERRAGLDRRLTSTHSFNQFSYHPEDSTAAGDGTDAEGDFDSLWKSL
ncbi:molecular chaperone [Pseudomonas sp. RGM2987]|uniref:molecular chaperone n=1 Tax=Pseudomonas sp. RGM2987 TaxID=2930090 RepID=UPI001FD6DAE4|nr:molecular chaperone [Pseudomonas sp. RGM2987]MCJ8206189.1 molecular chaperone [Pseudomonas sp. RGM2987]